MKDNVSISFKGKKEVYLLAVILALKGDDDSPKNIYIWRIVDKHTREIGADKVPRIVFVSARQFPSNFLVDDRTPF